MQILMNVRLTCVSTTALILLDPTTASVLMVVFWIVTSLPALVRTKSRYTYVKSSHPKNMCDTLKVPSDGHM